MAREIKITPDITQLIHQAAERIVDAAEKATREKDGFSIALSGGRTPQGLYELLATDAYRERIKWAKMTIFFGDERCVPPDSEQSNYRTANVALLSKVPIPDGQIHRMRGEIDPQTAAKEYGELLKNAFGDGGMDMILLGMGDDGHTASLFPYTTALHEVKHRCVANHVEKLNTWRLTMTAPFINRAAAVIILAAGKDKSARLHEVLQGPRDPDRLPIQLIQPETGTLTWLLDASAAAMLEEQ